MHHCSYLVVRGVHVVVFVFVLFSYFPASGQAVVRRVTGVAPSPTRFLRSIIIVPKVQQSHCSSIFRRVLLTHALAFSASQFVYKKKSPRVFTSMHSGRFELTKLTYTRLEGNLIRHREDRTCCFLTLTLVKNLEYHPLIAGPAIKRRFNHGVVSRQLLRIWI